MKNILIILLLFEFNVYADNTLKDRPNNRPIRVAIIDSGVDSKYLSNINLCKNSSISFSHKPYFSDDHGHGTNILGLIAKYAKNVNYCFIIIKYYSKSNTNKENYENFHKSLEYLQNMDVDVVNISGGGFGESLIEKDLITNLLNRGVTFIVSSGNTRTDLNRSCIFYPACYDKRIIVVGALDVIEGNKGDVVDVYESGYQQQGNFGKTFSGTSQATAIFTGKFLTKFNNR